MDEIGHVRPFEIPGDSQVNFETIAKNDFVVEGTGRKGKQKWELHYNTIF